MSMNFGNASFHLHDEHLLQSMPASTQMILNIGADSNENMLPISTQNYMDRYKELENILADEKRTSEELKQCYKLLKTDHAKQKNDCMDLRAQMTSLIEENKMMQEKYKAMFEKMQQESRRKQLIIEELKNKELDEIKLERLKDELSQQIEGPYKDIVKQLETELQKLQSEYSKVSFEIEFLKSVNSHDKQEHHSHLEQVKMKQEIELNAMRKDRDMLREKLQETNQVEIGKMKEVIRENNQFKIKVKALMEENDELREKIEHIEAQNNSLVRNHSKVLSDFTSKISILESEKESLKQQAENSHKETVNLNEQLSVSVRKLHDLERDNTKLKLTCEEVQHNTKKELASMKLQQVKHKGEESRAREQLNIQIEDLKLKLEVAEESVELHKKLLGEKEHELVKTMNTINEENWSKISELTNEKIELEGRFQIYMKDAEFRLNALQIEKDKSDDKLNAFVRQREEVAKENAHLRTLVLDSENLRTELDKEQEKNREIYRKFHKVEVELNTNTSMEQELTEINMRLKSEISFHLAEVQRSKEHISRVKDEYENRFNEWKSQYMAEKNDLKFKCEDLESKLKRANSKLADVQKFHDKKKKQYQAFSKSLKLKAETLNAKIKELKTRENISSKHSVPIGEYNKLKNQLIAIGKKHHFFKEMILNGNAQGDVQQQFQNMTNFNSLMSLNPVLSKFEANENFNRNFETNLILSNAEPTVLNMNKKFDELTNRLDFLTTVQNHHLKEHAIDDKIEALSVSIRSEKKSFHSPRKQESPRKSERHSIRQSPSPAKQIETKQISLDTSTSSVESFSKKLEKSAIMSPEEANILVSKSNNNLSISEKQAPPVKKRESDNIVIRKQTYSTSSEDDEDF